MEPFEWIMLASALAGTGLGVWNAATTQETNRNMMDLADTSVSRRVRDLKNAGMSPVLAAGSGAESPALEPARVDPNLGFQNALFMSQLQTAREQQALLREQTQGVKHDNDWKRRTLENRVKAEEYTPTLRGNEATLKHQYNIESKARESEIQERITEIRQRVGIESWNFTKRKILGLPTGIDPSSREAWAIIMNDPEVPTNIKIQFGLNRAWDEVKDIWSSFVKMIK